VLGTGTCFSHTLNVGGRVDACMRHRLRGTCDSVKSACPLRHVFRGIPNASEPMIGRLFHPISPFNIQSL